MSAGRGASRWLLVVSIVAVIGVGACVTFPILGVFPMVFFSVQRIKRQEAKMRRPEIYNEVGRSLAVYCQTGPTIFPTGFVGNAWLPKAVRELAPSETRISETNVYVMMGGGFYHYGYCLERQASFSQRSNCWNLWINSEGSNAKLLSSFSTLASETIPVSNFVANALQEYERLSKGKPDETEALWLEQRRINFVIQFDRSKLREACLSAIRDLPKHWWPRLTLALVDSSGPGREAAEKEFAGWIDSNPSYSRYIYLAYFYQQVEQPEQAAAAIERALNYPVIDLPDDVTNTECRGYSAAVYAFQSGKYATVIKLCDALLPVRENGDFGKAALKELRSAAVSAQSGTLPAFEPSQNVLGFNAYEYVKLAALRGQ